MMISNYVNIPATIFVIVATVSTIEAFVMKSPLPTVIEPRSTTATVSNYIDPNLQVVSSAREETFPGRLENFEKYWKELAIERPGYTKQFWALRSAVRKPDGPLDTKTKELIALALSVAATCDTCIAHHVYDALEAGATREEIADALGVVALMGGGVGVAYCTHAMRAVDQFEEMMKEKMS